MQSSYEQQGMVELSHWSVYEVPLYGPDAPWTRHFVGFDDELGQPQVSSVILVFDRESGVAASANHRIFKLVGKCGTHPESVRLWENWKQLNRVEQARDITPGFFKVPARSVARPSVLPFAPSASAVPTVNPPFSPPAAWAF